ncbi:MAG: exonuclease subunit SbcD [Treponema sp.]|nr:exonuclease subunit SbcD [Treponema sp.]
MRFIHTSDWHLGNRMHDTDRTEETAGFLTWLREEIVRLEADCLVIAGDIYDVANPPNEAKKQYCAFLASLIGTCCRNVIVVGGNHDSASLLDTEKDLLEALNIHVIGSLAGLAPEEMLFELAGKDGAAIGIAAAVPYARELELRSYISGDAEDGTVSDAAYGELYKRLWEAADRLRAGRKIPVIATGHLYASGLEGRPTGFADTGDDGTRSIDVLGNLGLVSPSVFPPSFDYVALGHIHYSTMVAKNPKIRYSGSPFVMGFDEAGIPRCVLCVDCEEGKTEVSKVEVPASVSYRRLEGSISQIREELEALSGQDGGEGLPCCLELYYRRDFGEPGLDVLDDAVARLPPHIHVVSWKRRDARTAISREGALDDKELRSLSDEDIFTSLIMSSKLCPPPEEEAARKNFLGSYLPLFMQVAGEIESEGDGK